MKRIGSLWKAVSMVAAVLAVSLAAGCVGRTEPPKPAPPQPPPSLVKPPEPAPPQPPPSLVKPPEQAPPQPPVVVPHRAQPLLVALTVIDLADMKAAAALCDYLGKLPGVQSVKLGAFSGGKGDFTIAYAPGSQGFRASLTAGLEKYAPRGIQVTSYSATGKPIRVEGRVTPPAPVPPPPQPILVALTVTDLADVKAAAALCDYLGKLPGVQSAKLGAFSGGKVDFTIAYAPGSQDIRPSLTAGLEKYAPRGIQVTSYAATGKPIRVEGRVNPPPPLPPIMVALTVSELADVKSAGTLREYLEKLPGVTSAKMGAWDRGKCEFATSYAPETKDVRLALTDGLGKCPPHGIRVVSSTVVGDGVRMEGSVNLPPPLPPTIVRLTVIGLPDARSAVAMGEYLGKLADVKSVKMGAWGDGQCEYTLAYAPEFSNIRPSLTTGLEKYPWRGIQVTSFTPHGKEIKVEGRVNPPPPIRVELTVADVPSETEAAALRDHLKGHEPVLAATLVSCKAGVATFTAFVPHGTPDVRKVFELAVGKFGKAGVTVTDCVEAAGLVKVAARMNPVVPMPTLGAAQRAAIAKEAADKLRLVRIICEETLELSGGSAKTAAGSRVLAEALQKAGYRVVMSQASFVLYSTGSAKLNEKFGNFYSFDASLAGQVLDPERRELAAVKTAAKRGERMLREDDAANSAIKSASGELTEKLVAALAKIVAAAEPAVVECETGGVASSAAAEQFRAGVAKVAGVYYASLEGYDAATHQAKYEILYHRGDKGGLDALRKAADSFEIGKVRSLAVKRADSPAAGEK